jgi:CubicO group peptidase (beta-lactamase class C family)
LLVAPIQIGRRPIVIALFVAFGAPISGNADQVDAYIVAQMRRSHIPGASLAIVRDGRTIKAQGYGFASLELRPPATKDTPFTQIYWW